MKIEISLQMAIMLDHPWQSLHIRVNYSNVEYRDGIKSKGDKIEMPCTHSTVI